MGPNYNKLDIMFCGGEIQNINKYGTIYLLLRCSTFHKKVALQQKLQMLTNFIYQVE